MLINFACADTAHYFRGIIQVLYVVVVVVVVDIGAVSPDSRSMFSKRCSTVRERRCALLDVSDGTSCCWQIIDGMVDELLFWDSFRFSCRGRRRSAAA